MRNPVLAAAPSGRRSAPSRAGVGAPLLLLALLSAIAGPADAQSRAPPLDGATVPAASAAPAAPAADDDPLAQLRWERDFSANCVNRRGVQILVRNAHPTRTLRVWLERWHMGRPTGDRSRSELRPGAEAEPLGCSRTDSGEQSWKPVRAQFVD